MGVCRTLSVSACGGDGGNEEGRMMAGTGEESEGRTGFASVTENKHNK